MITIKVTTHSGDEDLIQVESYDATDMETKWNDELIQGIKIGDNVYSRIDLKGIKLIPEDEEILIPNSRHEMIMDEPTTLPLKYSTLGGGGTASSTSGIQLDETY